MSYLIFRGVSTLDIPNVQISKMPAHKKAGMRYTEFYVKGRDGALHIDEGLTNYELSATLILIDGDASARQAVNAWASGSGKLITSDDLSKCYHAAVRKEVRWTRQPGNRGYFDTAQISFDCDPYMYEADEKNIVLTASGTITNPGTAAAIPLLVLEGSGTCSVTMGGTTFSISGVSSGVPVTLDCENGYAFAASGAMMMTGNFPEIPVGDSTVTLGGGTAKLTVTPHWRWI